MVDKNERTKFLEYLIKFNEKRNKETFDDNESSNANSDDYVEEGTTEPKATKDINERFIEERKFVKRQIQQKYKKIDDGLQRKYEELSKDLNKKYDELKDKYDELKDKYDNVNSKNIEIMSIFFTLFTVISVSVNISSNFQKLYSSLFFVFSIAFLLIAFLILFSFILHKNWDNTNKKPIWMLFLLALIVCFTFYYLAEKNDKIQNNISLSEETKPYIQNIAINNSNEKENVSKKISTSSSAVKKIM